MLREEDNPERSPSPPALHVPPLLDDSRSSFLDNPLPPRSDGGSPPLCAVPVNYEATVDKYALASDPIEGFREISLGNPELEYDALSSTSEVQYTTRGLSDTLISQPDCSERLVVQDADLVNLPIHSPPGQQSWYYEHASPSGSPRVSCQHFTWHHPRAAAYVAVHLSLNLLQLCTLLFSQLAACDSVEVLARDSWAHGIIITLSML